MPRIILAIILALPLAACLPQLEESHIVVDGKAKIKVEPDQFNVRASLASRGDTSEQVLKDISAKLTLIREETPKLKGLTHLEVDPSTVSVSPKYNAECKELRRYSDEEACNVEGYFSTISISVIGSPANQSGNILSLLSELGAEQVNLAGYKVTTYEDAREQAIASALKDARAKAEKLASASGTTISGLSRIQYGQGFSDGWRDGARPFIAGSPAPAIDAQDRMPDTELHLDPQPIEVSAEVVAAFKIN